ncbi:MAG: hypothetical protein OXC93_10650 [Rhodospirillaceae bacterium]|nr:hypothetical protein [Rhodospirillaceae bacterium]
MTPLSRVRMMWMECSAAGDLDDEAQAFCARFDCRTFSDREPLMMILWMAQLAWLMAC